MKRVHRIRILTVVFLFVVAFGGALSAQSLVTLVASNFDDPKNLHDGWRGTNSPTYQTNLPGGASADSVGYFRLVETSGDGNTMYFVAPAKFLGDKRAAYNGFLRFAHRQDATTQLGGGGNFVFIGSSTVQLSFSLRSAPATTWTRHEIPLNENVGWINTASNEFATKEDFLQVLASMTRLWIRAEFSTQSTDQGDLDDVEILAQPSGPLQPSLTASNYAGITIDGAVGASYRIEYRGAADPPEAWQKLSDVVLPVSPYLFIDTSSPGNSRRFYRAVLNP